MEKLPVDVLVQVAKFLPVAQWPDLERVNHRFRDAIYEAWRTMRKIRLLEDLLAGDSRAMINSVMSNQILEKLTRRALNISDIGGFVDYTLSRASIDLLVRFEKLERIEFGNQFLSLNDVKKFLKESANRERLKEVIVVNSVRERALPGEEPPVEAFREQDGLAPLKLEALDLSKNWRFDSWAFLEEINVSRLTSFFVIYIHVNRSLFVNFLNRAANLRKLAFSFDCRSDEESRDKDGLLLVEEHAPQLVLQLNKRIIWSVGKLERLVSLKMNAFDAGSYCECRNFEVEMVQMFNELGCRGALMELSLQHLETPAIVYSVAAALPNLHSLELSIYDYEQENMDLGLERVLKAQKSLTSLRLCGDRQYFPPIPIVSHIMANALHLKSLRLNFDDHFVQKEELMQIAAFKQLKDLWICQGRLGNDIDDEVLAAWADAFGSELESLWIPQCQEVTDKGILALVKKTSRLRELVVSGARITDHSLKQMATQCREIRMFEFSCRPATVTVEGVQAVLDGWVYLKRLCFSGKFPCFYDKLKVGKYRKIFFLERESEDDESEDESEDESADD